MDIGTRYRDLDTCLDDYRDWYVNNQERPQTFNDCAFFLFRAINGRLYILHLLRNEIMALRDSQTHELDLALEDFTTWYISNAETITDALPLLQFLKKATDDSLHLLHLMRIRIREVEGQQATAQDSPLWLPVRYR